MTVENNQSKYIYDGNGTTGPWNYPRYFIQDADIQVIKTSAAGDETELTGGGIDYTMSGAGSPSGGFATTTVAVAVGEKITVNGNVDYTQGDSYPETGLLPAKTVERGLDRLTMMVQQINEKIARAFKLKISSVIGEVIVDDPSPGKFLGWNATGTAITNYTGADTSISPVTAYMATVLTAANAAAARAAQGAAASGTNSDITSLSALTSINGGPLSGFRNLLINGNCSVWQRGTTFTNQTFAGATQYTLDRWIGNRAGDVNGQSISRYSITTADRTAAGQSLPQYGVKWQRAAADVSTAGMFQFYALETIDSLALAGKTVTLSIHAKVGANYSGGQLTIGVSHGTGTDQREPNFTGLTTSSASRTLTTSMQQISVTVAIPFTATQVGLRMSWTPVGTAGADDSVYFTAADLSIGSVAPANVELRSYATELAMCQRYYEKSFPQATAPAQNAGPGNATTAVVAIAAATTQSIPIIFKKTKRVVPTIVTFNPSAANAQPRNLDAGADLSGVTAYNTGQDIYTMVATGAVAGTVGQRVFLHWTAEAEL